MEGEIVRIESYGAFCALMGTRWQGLIHISQLYESRVEQVEDVVSLNDRVWVKILEVEEQQGSDDRRPRLRIKLSMKDVSQDGSRQDLGRQREQKEMLKTQLESNLNSMIGVAVARDPMENQRLILKGNNAASKAMTTFRGGYTLVGDDEGEPAEQEPAKKNLLANDSGGSLQLKPMGRGRGATLPAWMTSASNENGPTGDKKEDLLNDGETDESSRGKRKHKRKSHKKSSRKDHKHRSKKRSKTKHKKQSRYDDYSESSSRSSSDDGDGDRDERSKKRGKERGRDRDRRSKKRRRHSSRRSRREKSESSYSSHSSTRSSAANDAHDAAA